MTSLQRDVAELQAVAERRATGRRSAEAAVAQAKSDAAAAKAAACAAAEVAGRHSAKISMLRDVVSQQNAEFTDLKATLGLQQSATPGSTCPATLSSGRPSPCDSAGDAGAKQRLVLLREEPAKPTTLPTSPATAAAPAAHIAVRNLTRSHSELANTSEIADLRPRVSCAPVWPGYRTR